MMENFNTEATVLEILSQRFAFPSDYLILDCETTGFSRANDYIIDVGWAVVKDNQIVHQYNSLLDWSRLPVDHDRIKSQLLRQATQYGRINRPHYYPWERLCAEGDDPLSVLYTYTKLIYDYIHKPGACVIGHGFWRFDREVIDSHTHRFLKGYQLPWQPQTILDTGLIEKAAQTAAYPYESDTLESWMRRVNNANSRVKWNLEGHCVPKYRLIERYGLDMSLMHTAAFDCQLIYYLVDTYRQLMEILNGERQELFPR